MIIKRTYFLFFAFIPVFFGCSGIERSESRRIKRRHAVAEPITRGAADYMKTTDSEEIKREPYPWEARFAGLHPLITKDYFRCKGSSRREVVVHDNRPLFDCSGAHSLPIQDGKEFIWPQLVDLLNYLQEKTNKRVVITCGHRCPTHNTYADPDRYNQNSKHQIGAEVDFYIEGMENQPDKVIELILAYFPDPFSRYEKGGLNVRTPPWYNKEVFVKLYEEDEGRDLDNQHAFPYISVQMRYDKVRGEWITYSWDKAFKGFLRE
ncbi:MAG: hypothetical protein H7A40_06040 [Chlamydiales bacterium]|nr:hypothetical protein [Chlamydiales bacterium]